MSTKYHKQLISNTSKLINILRSVFSSNYQLLSSIDDAFEEELVCNIKRIPDAWIQGCNKTFTMLKDMALCIDYNKLALAVKNNTAKVWFDIDSYKFFRNNCLKTQGFSKNIETLIDNIAAVFKPLFNCIDYMFAHPEEICEQLAKTVCEDNQYSNLFSNI